MPPQHVKDYLKVSIIRLYEYAEKYDVIPTEESAPSIIGNIDILDKVFFGQCEHEIRLFHSTFGKDLTISRSFLRRFFHKYKLARVRSKSVRKRGLLEMRPAYLEFHTKTMLLFLSGKIDISCVINGDETSNIPFRGSPYLVTDLGANVSDVDAENDKYRDTATLGIQSNGENLPALLTLASQSLKKLNYIEELGNVKLPSDGQPLSYTVKTHSYSDIFVPDDNPELYSSRTIPQLSVSKILSDLLTPAADLKKFKVVKKKIFSIGAGDTAHTAKYSSRSVNTIAPEAKLPAQRSKRKMEEVEVMTDRVDTVRTSKKQKKALGEDGTLTSLPKFSILLWAQNHWQSKRRGYSPVTLPKKNSGDVSSPGTVQSSLNGFQFNSAEFPDDGLSAGHLARPRKHKKVTGWSTDPEIQAIMDAKFDAYHDWETYIPIYERLRALVYEKFQQECVADTPSEDPSDVIFVTYQKAAWSCERVFLSWLHHCVYPKIKGNLKKALVIVDNFPGHTTGKVQRYCLHKGINLMFLPANTTADAQPLDIGCNKPFKAGVARCKNKVNLFVSEGKGHKLKLDTKKFSLMAAYCGSQTITEHVILHSFRHMFLYPGSTRSEIKDIKKTLGIKSKK